MRIINKLEDCINKRPIISLFLSVFVGWALSWFLPSKPVSVGSMPPKELTCTLNYSHRLIKRGTTDQKLQILYDGQIVDDPRIFDITITNTGDFVITNDDFKEKFLIEFCGCNKILSAQVNNTSNHYVADELLTNATIENENLVFTDFMLNPNETFSINIITDKAPERVIYHSRISGISELTLRNTPKEKHLLTLWIGFSVIAMAFVSLIVLFIIERRSRKKYQYYFDALLKSCKEDTADA